MEREEVSYIHWLGHDSFRIEAPGCTIYIDPWKIQDGPPADLILITHEHHDHCSPDDVAALRQDGTVIVTIKAAAIRLKGDIQIVAPGSELVAKGIPIRAVPAYNVNKFRGPGVAFHPREAGHVGFVITVEGQRIYHAGDTDLIPEMEGLDVDIALLPVSGTYVMTAEEAAEAAAVIRPKVAIPMHIGENIGTLQDGERFAQQAPVPVIVLPRER
jgi:L-ascorbate metabolism protein UlaG (beta-lactamase superfamily)